MIYAKIVLLHSFLPLEGCRFEPVRLQSSMSFFPNMIEELRLGGEITTANCARMLSIR